MTAFAIRFRSGFRCALLLCALAAGAGPEARAQLRIDSSFTPTALVKRFFEGGCAEIRNVRYRGAKGALGLFDGSNTNIGMDLGILMTTGDLRSAVGPNDLDSAGRANGYIYGDFQLDSLVKGHTYEAAVLDFDFTSFIDTVSFEYVFGSEEYPEFVGSKYNDVFAFFVTDLATGGTRNIALIPGTATPVSINTVNDWLYWQHYINNNNGATIQYDGFTRVLRALLAVTPCSTYHMKIAIADVADDIYDSGVFLKAGSFNAGSRVSIETVRDAYEGGCVPGIFRFRRSGSTVAPLTITFRIGGTATDSADFERFSKQLTFPVGVDSVDVFVRARTDSLADAGETVSVAFDNTCACAATTSVMTIREAPPLRLFTSGDTTCCLGGTATLRAYAAGGSGSHSWQWNPGPGIDSVLAYQPLSTRRVDVTVTDLLTGCVLRDSILVTVLAPPVVDAGPDIVVCHQKGVTIGNPAQGGPEPYNYQWSPAVGLSNSRVAQPVARPALTTMYTVTVTSAIGCVSTDSVLVRASNVNFGLGRTRVICPGESALIGGAASGGTEPYSYAWTPAEGLDDSTARYAVAAPVRSTIYTLAVRDALGCVYRDSVLVSVRDVPPLNIEPAGPVTICDGRPLILRASAGFVSYAWNAGGNADSMVVVASGTYLVTVTDSNGCRAQDSVRVRYRTAPSPSVRVSGPTLICEGDSVLLVAEPDSLRYIWSNGDSTRGITARSTGSYWVTAIDSAGCTGVSTPVDIRVIPMPRPVISGAQTVCTGSTVSYSVPGDSGDVIEWTVTSGSIESGAGTRDLTVRWDSSGTGSVSARVSRSSAGCAATATVNVLVGSSFQFSIRRPARLTACDGDSLLLEAPSGLLGIRWSNGATTRGIVARASGVFFVTAVDSIGCPGLSDTVTVRFEVAPRPSVQGPGRVCAGTTAVYATAAHPAASSGWTVRNGSLVSSAGGDSILVRWDMPGRGVVHVRQALDSLGCAGEDSIAVDVTAPPKPAIARTGGTTLCEGDTLVLNVTPYRGYRWSTGDTTRGITVRKSGRYFVTVTDSSGCTGGSDTVLVAVDARPVVHITALGALAFCDGDSVLLDAGDFRRYLWNTGDTTRSIVVKRGGVYTLQARGPGSCDGYSDTVAVMVFARPAAGIVRAGDTLTALPPGMRYRWSRDGVFGVADTARALIASEDGRYRVEVTSPDGCAALSPPYDMTRVDLTVTATVLCPAVTTVAPGERLTVVVRLQLPAAFQTSGISAAELFLHARENVFAVTGATDRIVSRTGSTLHLRLTRDLARVAGTDVDIPVELLAMLGDTGCSRIVLDSVRWQGGRAPVTFANPACDICVRLCEEGGARLFSGDARATLAQNHPNPFNASTALTYTLIERGYTRLAVFDRLGREVAVLDEGMRAAGVYRAVFDGSAMPSGVYTVLLLTPTLALQRTMVLMK